MMPFEFMKPRSLSDIRLFYYGKRSARTLRLITKAMSYRLLAQGFNEGITLDAMVQLDYGAVFSNL